MPNSLNPSVNKSTAQYLIQAPNVLIYRNGTALFTASGANGKIDLELDNGAVFNMTKMSITSTNDTTPNTLSIEFALDTSAMMGYKMTGKDTPAFGVDSPIAHWAPFDHIEVFIAPNVEEGRYYRSFVGVISTIDFTINSNIILYKLEARDLLFWLENSRINPRLSMFDIAIRNPDLFTTKKEQIFNAALTKTKYTGVTFKDIIEKMLFNTEEINALSEITGSTYIRGIAGMSTQPGVALPKTNDGYIQKVYASQKQYLDATGKLTTTSPSDSVEVQAKFDQAALAEKKKVGGTTLTEAIGSFAPSAEDYMQMRIEQDSNSDNLGVYWENEFLSFMQDNYVGMYRRDDIVALPIPVTTFDAPLMWESSYETRLGMLKQMQEWSLYEIYQSHNGFVFVKPPMYNAPPLARIYPVELQSLQRTKNIQNALTSATTEGLLVFDTGKNTTIPEIGLESKEFPFIYGSYKVLFPTNFPSTPLTSIDFTGSGGNGKGKANPFKYNVSSYPAYKKIIDNIKHTGDKTVNYQYTDTSFSVTMDNGADVKAYDVSTPGSGDNMSMLLVYQFLKDNLTAKELSSLDMTINPRKMTQTQKTVKVLTGFTSHNKTITEIAPEQNYTPRYDMVQSPYGVWFTKLRYYLEEDKRYTLFGCDMRPFINLLTRISGDIYAKATQSELKPTDDYQRENLIRDYLHVNLFPLVQEAITKGALDTKGAATVRSLVVPAGPTREAVRTFQLPVLAMVMRGKFTLDKVNISTGEYNVMQNGYRDAKLTNPMIRTSKQAVAFSKYYIYINNAKVEANAFTLKTLRPDIIPGFPILNTFDMCVYYVTALQMDVVPGEAVTTTITGIARRRPIYADITVLSEEALASYTMNPEKFLKICCFSDSTDPLPDDPTLTYTDVFTHTVTPSNADSIKFVGWEMYGPRDMQNLETPGVFCAPFGGHITAQNGNTDTNGNTNTPSPKRGKGLIFTDTTIFKLGPAQNVTELNKGALKQRATLDIFKPVVVAKPAKDNSTTSSEYCFAPVATTFAPVATAFAPVATAFKNPKIDDISVFEYQVSGPGRLIVVDIDINPMVTYTQGTGSGRRQYQLDIKQVTVYSPETLRKRLTAEFKRPANADRASVDTMVAYQARSIKRLQATGISVKVV